VPRKRFSVDEKQGLSNIKTKLAQNEKKGCNEETKNAVLKQKGGGFAFLYICLFLAANK